MAKKSLPGENAVCRVSRSLTRRFASKPLTRPPTQSSLAPTSTTLLITMDAWIRNLMKTVSGSGSRRDEPEILLCKRRSTGAAASAPSSVRAAPLQSPTAVTTLNTRPTCTSPSRIAHWDKKREKCRNCTLIYLKTLSRHPGYCSVDCKSNAAYLDKVNRTIRAMKVAVEQHHQQHQQEVAAKPAVDAVVSDQQRPQAPEPVVEDESNSCEPESDRSLRVAHTFSEFGLDSRILDASNVEWAFSALY